MKVLHVLYSGLGGHGNIFFAMVNAECSKEFAYEALFYGIEEVRNEFIEQCEEKKISWYFAKKNVKHDLRYYFKILNFIRKSNPDVIFLHGSSYILPAKIAAILSKKKCKIIVRETHANHLKTREQWISLGLAMYLADSIVCLTVEFRDQVKKKLGRLNRPAKVKVISNGINLEIYRPGKKTVDGIIVIGMQSRLVRIKDHTTLLKAFSLLKHLPAYSRFNLKLRIAGDGDFKTELERMAHELDLDMDVEFTGMIAEEKLVQFLQSLDIYVHASLGETMSTSIMQAMACKLPIIASNVNGINNMIMDNVTGKLVSVQDEKALANEILTFLENPDMRDEYAQNAFEYALTNFSNQKMAESYKGIFLAD